MEKKRLLIIGCGEAGKLLLNDIKNNKILKYNLVGFLDDFKNLNKKVLGLKVLGKIEDIGRIVKKYSVDEIIIAIPSLKKERLREIVSLCENTGLEIKILPSSYESMYSLKTGRPWYNKIRKINVEDLLRRKPALINAKEILDYVKKRNILVTGGGGSIGSELCRQICELNPNLLIILDNCEYNLYNIEMELKDKFSHINLVSAIADVRDFKAIEEIINKNKVNIVFHAAAYKHVPLMENNVKEVVKNNIFGTYNVAKAAEINKVEDFVFISTDKAVHPKSIMGTTKKISESVIRLFDDKTKFVTVRFGNVLGSRGSVVPLFESQIEKGGPITITHPDMTRYFMTIPEAAQLVIQAGSIGKNKEILVLDMGEPYKIIDLAKDLIKLHGLNEEDIPIKIIGLRPGEKLHEELMSKKELLTKTKNERIFIGSSGEINKENFLRDLKNLKLLVKDSNEENIRKMLNKMVTY